jgi:hypothetical protein
VVVGWLLLGLAVAVLVRMLRRKSRDVDKSPVLCDIRVADLPCEGPSIPSPRLEFYGTPVRLAVVVLAPVGRQGQLPPEGLLASLWEALVPGIGKILELHRPFVVLWPAQLSSQGFTQLFFHHLALPGDRGRGTPWCSVAGKFDWMHRQYLVGMVCCAASSNGLGQATVQHQGLWLDVLRVRD